MTDANLSELARAELSHRGWRMLKDRLFGLVTAVGGVTVILAILTIFFYLLYVVFPLLRGAALTTEWRSATPLGAVRYLALNEYADVAFAVADDGTYRFEPVKTGAALVSGNLVPRGERLTAAHGSQHAQATLALGFASGKALLVRPSYLVNFNGNVRHTTPQLTYPAGVAPINAAPDGSAIKLVTAEASDDAITIIALTAANELYLTHLSRQPSLLENESTFEQHQVQIPLAEPLPAFLMMDVDQSELYVISATGHVTYYDIRNKEAPKLVQDLQVAAPDIKITAAAFLSGGTSLLLGDNHGTVTQWFPVRDEENNYQLTRIRRFSALSDPVVAITPEYYRKGFAALDASGTLGLFHTTAERTLLTVPHLVNAPLALAYSAHADVLAMVDGTEHLTLRGVANTHPEVSWRALWGKVWYEGRSQPEFIWQSSSASSDFEPKFSLTPLAFGTLKAAVYAMVFAIPVAIFGALYTAYFMHSRLRIYVKPSIEIMAALPTVILGFLAGLWLAPLIETHLIGVLGATLLLPLTFFTAALVWSRVPGALRHRVPDGFEVLLLIPVVCAVLWLAMDLSQPLEQLWFGGNLPRWLTRELGLTYDQRNSLVVGIAMGFAVIPNIFSISEDAIFGVPRQLTTGSLALGATPWQTVTRVVLLTASPGIFSAIMIGLGRAVGETMIVLMSTGNTPIMDASIFTGFRALSANIAVEMPESEINSTHYRVLFLAALVLFAVTFIFNTVAELVRQRLRAKYGNL